VGKLIYGFNTSLDGYIEDSAGTLDWSVPDEELHKFWNSFEASIGTHLYGRRLYETMRYWETAHEKPDQPPVALEYARIWQAIENVVYSTTLDAPSTGHTRVERTFDVDAVARMKAASAANISIGGAELAAHAIRAGLVDEYHTVVVPVVLGSGKRFLPDDVRIDLELVDERRFPSGAVYLAYSVRHAS
jgi:dihydrofolate reductase